MAETMREYPIIEAIASIDDARTTNPGILRYIKLQGIIDDLVAALPYQWDDGRVEAQLALDEGNLASAWSCIVSEAESFMVAEGL